MKENILGSALPVMWIYNHSFHGYIELHLHAKYGWWYIISYHVISCHIISYHIVSYRIVSYPIISYHIISLSYRIISYHIVIISYHIISYRIISYHVISYRYHIVIISYHIISYRYHIVSYHIISYHIPIIHSSKYHWFNTFHGWNRTEKQHDITMISPEIHWNPMKEHFPNSYLPAVPNTARESQHFDRFLLGNWMGQCPDWFFGLIRG